MESTLNTAYNRLKGRVICIAKKIAQADSDLKFLTRCKKCGVIPKGLKLRNPLQNTLNSRYAEVVCYNTSSKLLKHLIHLQYKKRRLQHHKIEELITDLDFENRQDIRRLAQSFIKKLVLLGGTVLEGICDQADLNGKSELEENSSEQNEMYPIGGQ